MGKRIASVPAIHSNEEKVLEEILVQELLEEASHIHIRFADELSQSKTPHVESRLLELQEEQVLRRHLLTVRNQFRRTVIVHGTEEIANSLDVKKWTKEMLFEMFYMDYDGEDPVNVSLLRERLPNVRRKLLQLLASKQRNGHSRSREVTQENMYMLLEQYPLRIATLVDIGKTVDGEHAEEVEESSDAYNAATRGLLAFNVRLVMDIAQKYHEKYNERVCLGDLEQQGMLGFFRAMETLNAENQKLSTYATEWIRQAVQNGVTREARGFAIPDNPSRKRMRMKARREQERLDRGEQGQLTESQKKLIRVAKTAKSFSTEPGKPRGLADTLPESQPRVGSRLDQEELTQTLDAILRKLEPIEEWTIRMRNGLPCRPGLQPYFPQKAGGYSQEEVAALLKVKRQAVQQREQRIWGKLRRHSRNKSLQAFIEGYAGE